jgi:amino acid transporter
LKNKLGILSISCIGVNIIAGAGIFLLPHNAFAILGPHMLPIFVLVVLVTFGVALSYAEMASKYDKAGACYLYAKENLGEYAAFIVAFTRYIAAILLWAAMATGFSEMLGSFHPFFKEPHIKIIFAMGIVIILSLINLRGISTSKTVNNIFTFAKLVPIILFCLTGVFFINPQNLSSHLDYTGSFQFAQGFLLLFFAYGGIEDISLLASDMKDPKKDVPKAVVSVLIILSLIYLLILISAQGILGGELAKSTNPVADAMTKYMGPIGGVIVSIGIVIALIGSNVSLSFLYPRKALSLVEIGILSKSVEKHNKNNAPHYAIILTMVLTCILILIGNFAILAEFVMITISIQYLLTMVSVFVSRKRGLKGNFRFPFSSFFIILSFVVLIVMLLQLKITELFWGGIIWIVVGTILFFFFSKKRV